MRTSGLLALATALVAENAPHVQPEAPPPRPVGAREMSVRYLVDVLPKRYHLTVEETAQRARASGEWDEQLAFSPLFLIDEWRYRHGSLAAGIGFDAGLASEEDLSYLRFGFAGVFSAELNLASWCRGALVARLGGGSARVRLPADLAAALGDDRDQVSDFSYSLIGALTFGGSDNLRWGFYGGYGGTYGTSNYAAEDEPYLELSTYGPLAGLLWVHRF